jgi:hypothetical protein
MVSTDAVMSPIASMGDSSVISGSVISMGTPGCASCGSTVIDSGTINSVPAAPPVPSADPATSAPAAPASASDKPPMTFKAPAVKYTSTLRR